MIMSKVKSQYAGDFDTADAEIDIVIKALHQMRDKLEEAGVQPLRAYKSEDRDASDVTVLFKKGNRNYEKTFEVKYEGPDRWARYGEYGFEGGTERRDGTWKPSKAEYSEADYWLFYTDNEDGSQVLGVYNFNANRDLFLEAQKRGVMRYTTSKNYRTGHIDTYKTKVYFVKPELIEGARIL